MQSPDKKSRDWLNGMPWVRPKSKNGPAWTGDDDDEKYIVLETCRSKPSVEQSVQNCEYNFDTNSPLLTKELNLRADEPPTTATGG